jgi:tetratricopeptide (TPR) repeat protein
MRSHWAAWALKRDQGTANAAKTRPPVDGNSELGNVLDETRRVDQAIAAYNTALQLAPTYADAHYNVALAYERIRQPRRAMRHWRAYLKLDGSGPWAVHARAQYKKLLDSEPLKIVHRS